jgi:hypothetical protein
MASGFSSGLPLHGKPELYGKITTHKQGITASATMQWIFTTFPFHP